MTSVPLSTPPSGPASTSVEAEEVIDHARTRRGSLIRTYWPVAALALLAAGLSWWSSHAVFPAYSWNRDEPVYVWQAETLRAGMFGTPDGNFPQFFHPWLSAERGGEFFSQYTLGWPLVLLVGDVLFGSPAAGLAFGAALAVVGTYAFARTVLEDHVGALVAAALMTASPIIIVQGGVYLAYLFTLGLGLCFGAALISGVRAGKRLRVVTAGALLGYIFLTRPFDVILWAAAIGGPLAFTHRHEMGRLFRNLSWFTLGALPLVAVTLAYNQRMTGSLTRFPVTVKEPLDTFGFGLRRIMPEFAKVDYGIITAVKGTLKNGFYLLLFVVGGVVSLPVAVFGLRRRLGDPMNATLFAVLAAFPLGYFLFWGTNVSSLTSRISAPIYYLPMYAPLCILVAVALVDVGRRRLGAAIVLAAALVVAGLPFAINRITTNHRISVAQEPWKQATAELRARQHDSLVFVADSGPYLMFLNPFSANAPNLDDQVLWAVDRVGENIALIEAMPERTAYRMQASFRGDELDPDEQPLVAKISLLPLDIVHGDKLVVRADIENPTEHPVVVVTMRIDGRLVQRTLADDSERGAHHEFTWTLSRADASKLGSVLGLADGTYTLGVGFGATRAEAAVPTVRSVLPYRTTDRGIDALVPVRAERLSVIDRRKLRWRPTTDLPEITITVQAT